MGGEEEAGPVMSLGRQEDVLLLADTAAAHDQRRQGVDSGTRSSMTCSTRSISIISDSHQIMQQSDTVRDATPVFLSRSSPAGEGWFVLTRRAT
jgi:hypothetical protein